MREILLVTAIAISVVAYGALAQQAAEPATQAPGATTPESAPSPVAPGGTAATPAPPLLVPLTSGPISTDALIGASIQTPDAQDIAAVEDVLLSPAGMVENLVVQFGGFLGFGSDKVLLTLEEVEIMQDDAGNIVLQTSLTPESLEGRPVYEDAS